MKLSTKPQPAMPDARSLPATLNLTATAVIDIDAAGNPIYSSELLPQASQVLTKSATGPLTKAEAKARGYARKIRQQR